MSRMDKSHETLDTNDMTETTHPAKRKKLQKTGLPGNHGKSKAWDHFVREFGTGTGREKFTGKAVCNWCHKEINAPSDKGTNYAWHHLNKCSIYLKACGDGSQQTLSFTEGKLSNWTFDQVRSRNALIKMIILDELPFSHVEGEGFKKFCEEVQPKLNLISRTTVARDSLKIYHEERLALKEYFNVMHTRVCITTDLWTSVQRLGYMVITAHFVDKDWNLRKKIINFHVVPHPHNGDHLAKTIERCLIGWGLDKITTITLDNASNNNLCVDDLKRRMKKKLLLGGEYMHVRCFAHVLNLVVQVGINMVIDTIKRLRRSVKYVRTGSMRMQTFKQYCKDEGLIYKKAMCIDVKTRWNSTYIMIDAALGYERAFDRLGEDSNYILECSKEKKKNNKGKKNKGVFVGSDGEYDNDMEGIGQPIRKKVMDEEDWQKLRSLHAFLEKFFLMTKRISGSHYITSNSYFDELTQVKELLMKHLSHREVYFQEMAKVMNKKFEKYCGMDKINVILIIGMVLDPRFKLRYVTLWYGRYLKIYESYFDEEEINAKVSGLEEKVKKVMSKLYESYKEDDSLVDVVSLNNTESSKRDANDIGQSMKEELMNLLKKKDNLEITNDLDRYLRDDVEESVGIFDVLAWWKGRCNVYHSLALVARDVLSIPITSVASESAFSTAGRVLDPFRSSLTPTILEALICTQDWLRKPIPKVSVEEDPEELEKVEKGTL